MLEPFIKPINFKIKKFNPFLLAATLCMVGVLMLSGTYGIARLLWGPTDAGDGGGLPVHDIIRGGALFSCGTNEMLDGTMQPILNPELKSNLMALVARTQKSRVAPNSPFATEYFASTARDIARANGGILPTIHMFNYRAMVDTHQNTFLLQSWRLVYISYPMVDDQADVANPVFTFMMTATYRNSVFNTAASAHNYNSTVSSTNEPDVTGDSAVGPSSVLRNTVVTDFEAILDNYPDARAHFVTTGGVPGNWQRSQPLTNTTGVPNISSHAGIGQMNLTGDRLNDIIWVPSAQELRTNGIWATTTAQRTFLGAANPQSSAWLRSTALQSMTPPTRLTSASTAAMNFGSDGDVATAWVTSLHGILPAVHISLNPVA